MAVQVDRARRPAGRSSAARDAAPSVSADARSAGRTRALRHGRRHRDHRFTPRARRGFKARVALRAAAAEELIGAGTFGREFLRRSPTAIEGGAAVRQRDRYRRARHPAARRTQAPAFPALTACTHPPRPRSMVQIVSHALSVPQIWPGASPYFRFGSQSSASQTGRTSMEPKWMCGILRVHSRASSMSLASIM